MMPLERTGAFTFVCVGALADGGTPDGLPVPGPAPTAPWVAI